MDGKPILDFPARSPFCILCHFRVYTNHEKEPQRERTKQKPAENALILAKHPLRRNFSLFKNPVVTGF